MIDRLLRLLGLRSPTVKPSRDRTDALRVARRAERMADRLTAARRAELALRLEVKQRR